MSQPSMPPLPDNLLEMLNQSRGGFNRAMGLTFVRATEDEVVAELTIDTIHQQPYGLVHGGVYSAMIETLASTGAAIHAIRQGRQAVGLENHTSFLRAVRGGTLTGRATPLVRGRRSHVWQVEVRDAKGRLAAKGTVRMLCVEPGQAVAGETLTVQSASDQEA